jgi:hypothetical protein
MEFAIIQYGEKFNIIEVFIPKNDRIKFYVEINRLAKVSLPEIKALNGKEGALECAFTDTGNTLQIKATAIYSYEFIH